MNFPRSDHGICYCNGAIYVVGGYSEKDENSSINYFEKFDFD